MIGMIYTVTRDSLKDPATSAALMDLKQRYSCVASAVLVVCSPNATTTELPSATFSPLTVNFDDIDIPTVGLILASNYEIDEITRYARAISRHEQRTLLICIGDAAGCTAAVGRALAEELMPYSVSSFELENQPLTPNKYILTLLRRSLAQSRH